MYLLVFYSSFAETHCVWINLIFFLSYVLFLPFRQERPLSWLLPKTRQHDRGVSDPRGSAQPHVPDVHRGLHGQGLPSVLYFFPLYQIVATLHLSVYITGRLALIALCLGVRAQS